MQYSAPTDGFRLAYECSGAGSPAVLLHGWPGDHTDWDKVVVGLVGNADMLRPDLRGFGQSDKHDAEPEEIYSGRGQARAVAALMDELGVTNAVVAGYDVGSFVSQTLAAMAATNARRRPSRDGAKRSNLRICCMPQIPSCAGRKNGFAREARAAQGGGESLGRDVSRPRQK